MTIQRIVTYLLLAVLVMILGAFFGWYLFLRAQTSSTTSFSGSLGLGTAAPFGTIPGTSAGEGISSPDATSTPGTGKPPQLWHVSSAPVAGFGFATSSDGVVVRYVDRATGHVYEANVGTGAITRLTNTLLPKIYDASIASRGRVIERSLDASGTITTFNGRLGTGTSTELTGTQLESGIEAIAADPNSDSVFTLLKSGTGVVGSISTWAGTKPSVVFTSRVAGWRAKWLTDGRIVLVQKAADGVPGYSYEIRKGVTTPLLDPVAGLTVAPAPDSNALLYSAESGGAPVLYLRTTGDTAVVLPLSTVADKCAWAPAASTTAFCAVPQTIPSGKFLDQWYRGEVHTADTIWQIDGSSASTSQVFVPDSGTSLDMTDLSLDPSGSYLAFIDTTRNGLWVLRLVP